MEDKVMYRVGVWERAITTNSQLLKVKNLYDTSCRMNESETVNGLETFLFVYNSTFEAIYLKGTF